MQQQPQNPNKLCETLISVLACSCIEGWTVTKFISAGAHGHVFRVVNVDGTLAVAKVQTGDAKRLTKELKSQKAFFPEKWSRSKNNR